MGSGGALWTLPPIPPIMEYLWEESGQQQQQKRYTRNADSEIKYTCAGCCQPDCCRSPVVVAYRFQPCDVYCQRTFTHLEDRNSREDRQLQPHSSCKASFVEAPLANIPYAPPK